MAENAYFRTALVQGPAGPSVFSGEISIAAPDSNWTEPQANQAYEHVIYSGTLTANRTVTYAQPGAPVNGVSAGYTRKTIKNATTGGFAIVVSVGAGSTVTIAAGTSLQVGLSYTGVIPLGGAF